MKIPYISSEWRVLLRPQINGKYINDHCVFKAHDGKYHLFGITSFEGGAPKERYFVHGTTPSLDCEMTEESAESISDIPADIMSLPGAEMSIIFP